jgi:hypothetical protein
MASLAHALFPKYISQTFCDMLSTKIEVKTIAIFPVLDYFNDRLKEIIFPYDH